MSRGCVAYERCREYSSVRPRQLGMQGQCRPNTSFTITYLREKQIASEAIPLVEESRWLRLPNWIALYPERGRDPLCFFGHPLVPAIAPRFSSCYKCHLRPIPEGEPVLWCPTCDFWSLCSQCAALPRLLTFSEDPLFYGRDNPCLIDWSEKVKSARGTVIICPGGNYEFLCPNEAEPVTAWLADHGIYSVVLRYRLLPTYRGEDAIDDLCVAIDHARSTREGPVVALGFSAGGHMIATHAVRQVQKDRLLDGQVLVYAGIDGSEWLDPITCGFNDYERCLPVAPSLVTRQPALLGGPGFCAPPSFLVYSTYDATCPPEAHGDRYAAALKEAGVPHNYLRGEYGEHGFGLDGGWTDPCVTWLQSLGLGSVRR